MVHKLPLHSFIYSISCLVKKCINYDGECKFFYKKKLLKKQHLYNNKRVSTIYYYSPVFAWRGKQLHMHTPAHVYINLCVLKFVCSNNVWFRLFGSWCYCKEWVWNLGRQSLLKWNVSRMTYQEYNIRYTWIPGAWGKHLIIQLYGQSADYYSHIVSFIHPVDEFSFKETRKWGQPVISSSCLCIRCESRELGGGKGRGVQDS